MASKHLSLFLQTINACCKVREHKGKIHVKKGILLGAHLIESIQKIMTTFPSMFSGICNKYAEKIRLLPNKMTFYLPYKKAKVSVIII